MIISAVISNGKSYTRFVTLTLPAQSENLEIDYAALSLAIPERVLFRYKLDGVDNDWQNAGTRRQAYYTKLRPGTYAFHVIACNNDGVWNEQGATLDLNVAPAWFQTTWFLVLCVASGIFAGGGVLPLSGCGSSPPGMNARFDERLAERTRIAQELHDTLLQGFLSASMQVHVAMDLLPDDSKIKPILTRALQLMGQVIDEGRNAVRGLRLSDVALAGFGAGLCKNSAGDHPCQHQWQESRIPCDRGRSAAGCCIRCCATKSTGLAGRQ